MAHFKFPEKGQFLSLDEATPSVPHSCFLLSRSFCLLAFDLNYSLHQDISNFYSCEREISLWCLPKTEPLFRWGVRAVEVGRWVSEGGKSLRKCWGGDSGCIPLTHTPAGRTLMTAALEIRGQLGMVGMRSPSRCGVSRHGGRASGQMTEQGSC